MRRIIILIITSISCIFCSSQTKINKSKEIDISITTPLKLETKKEIMYSIKNNSDKTYIIDPYGFAGESYWLLNTKKMNPIQFSRGYYSHDKSDCINDIIIIKSNEKIEKALSLNYRERAIYDYSETGNYVRVVKSNHNKQNSMPLSCKQYIDDLELKGYHFLNDSIVANIPFVK
ncbi:hypothetical protein [Chryseobacterium cheonjiense]|uniref:Uncharacterized protein n=1 Tax=Chryseobacterium cheonjiense TaxID=2728845 RepID=A0A7Y0FHU1_9FLAO|nr:hypothetical protein [Chryseobacterium cheonjiense]NML56724.1 hypothetical protein [Chryseobacterium cheonjiense]